MRALKEAMLLLIANDAPLGPEWLDHPLKGEWAGYRECHIGGDFLLIYEVDDQAGKRGTIIFVRAGTHADLFSEYSPSRSDRLSCSFVLLPARSTQLT